jgi:transposase
VIAVPPPTQCDCGGSLELERIEFQYQQEIVRKTIWRRFDIAICRCKKCKKRVQGRDPRQTSDALGAAAVQLGPEVLALAVKMNKGLGMPHADVAAVLRDAFHLEANRSTICRAVDRVARRGEATWHALRDAARRSMVNGIDETGWNVAAQLRWLWVVVSEQVTVCDILPGRGFEQAASLLGRDYAGWLKHDGWAVYYKFLRAGHQSCITHLIRRCGDMLEVCSPVAARFPLAVKAILEKGLALRDRHQQGEISTRGLWTATGRLEAELDRLLARSYRDSANRRLANHLCRERAYLFTFLYCPGLDATNNAAERALRPLVVARKNWGGNRSENGARAQLSRGSFHFALSRAAQIIDGDRNWGTDGGAYEGWRTGASGLHRSSRHLCNRMALDQLRPQRSCPSVAGSSAGRLPATQVVSGPHGPRQIQLSEVGQTSGRGRMVSPDKNKILDLVYKYK